MFSTSIAEIALGSLLLIMGAGIMAAAIGDIPLGQAVNWMLGAGNTLLTIVVGALVILGKGQFLPGVGIAALAIASYDVLLIAYLCFADNPFADEPIIGDGAYWSH